MTNCIDYNRNLVYFEAFNKMKILLQQQQQLRQKKVEKLKQFDLEALRMTCILFQTPFFH